MKKSAFSALLSFYSILAIAQSPAIQWQKSLGGTKSDIAYDVKQTTDGGYIATGTTASHDYDVTGFHGGPLDAWVVKVSSSGSLQWQRTLGANSNEGAHSVAQTADGGYIVAGYSSDSVNGDITIAHGGFDFWVIKLDDTGAIKWERSLGGTGHDEATVILQTSDGGYIVAGSSDSANGDVIVNRGLTDIWVVKLDFTGAIQWERSLGGEGDEYARAIQQTADNGYIIAGTTNSAGGDITGNHGANDGWLVKLSATGVTEWQKCLGGSQDDAATSIAVTTDGGYIVAGYSYSQDGDLNENFGHSDFWTTKLTSSGSIEWTQSAGGLSYEEAHSVVQTATGNYIVTGWTVSNSGNVIGNHGYKDYWTIELSATGGLLWQKCMGGVGTEEANCIRQTADGGYILAGYSDSSSGNVTGNHGMTDDFWIVKLGAYSEVKTPATGSLNAAIVPNPTTGTVSVSGVEKVDIKVYNTMGQLVKEADNTDNISISTLPTGIYFIKLLNEQGEVIKQDKIAKE